MDLVERFSDFSSANRIAISGIFASLTVNRSSTLPDSNHLGLTVTAVALPCPQVCTASNEGTTGAAVTFCSFEAVDLLRCVAVGGARQAFGVRDDRCAPGQLLVILRENVPAFIPDVDVHLAVVWQGRPMGALVSLVCAAHSSRVPRLHFAPSPARVAVKSSVTGSEADEQPKEGLDEFISTRCPSLYKEFSPAWWLFK